MSLQFSIRFEVRLLVPPQLCARLGIPDKSLTRNEIQIKYCVAHDVNEEYTTLR